MNKKKIFGQLVEGIIKGRKLEDVAIELGISESTISQLRYGRNPSIESCNLIAERLNLPRIYLFHLADYIEFCKDLVLFKNIQETKTLNWNMEYQEVLRDGTSFTRVIFEIPDSSE